MEQPINSDQTTAVDLEDRKREIAYKLWEDEGCPEGRADDHWSQACLVLMSLDNPASAELPSWLSRQQPDAAVEGAAPTATASEVATESPLDIIRRRVAGRSAA